MRQYRRMHQYPPVLLGGGNVFLHTLPRKSSIHTRKNAKTTKFSSLPMIGNVASDRSYRKIPLRLPPPAWQIIKSHTNHIGFRKRGVERGGGGGEASSVRRRTKAKKWVCFPCVARRFGTVCSMSSARIGCFEKKGYLPSIICLLAPYS